MAKSKNGICAYCGKEGIMTEDHIFSRQLWPNTIRWISHTYKVPAHRECNNSYSDDESYFNSIIILSGEMQSNDLRLKYKKYFKDKLHFSYGARDGFKKIGGLINILKLGSDGRLRINIMHDPRILRIIRKHIKGLCCYHNVLPVIINDERIIVYCADKEDAGKLLNEQEWQYGKDLGALRYLCNKFLEEAGLNSMWLINYMGPAVYLCMVTTKRKSKIRRYLDRMDKHLRFYETKIEKELNETQIP